MGHTIWHVNDLAEPGAPRVEQYAVAVVIDVVRAFTVAPWCLKQGAGRLLLAPGVDAALSAKTTRFPDALLLKDGPPHLLFDLPNAPGRIAREDLSGRTVIQTTGNGTRGAHAVAAAPIVLCASFVTASATARAVATIGGRALFVPTEGDEDDALVDYVLALLAADGHPVDPAAYLERVTRSTAGRECIARGPDPAYPGVDPDDLTRCCEVDAYDHALRALPDGDLLAVHPV